MGGGVDEEAGAGALQKSQYWHSPEQSLASTHW